MARHLDSAMQACVDTCLDCHTVCLSTASRHCLEAGGDHVRPVHFRLMMACAEICRTSAAFMSIGVPQHTKVCAVCAEVCEACAESCASVGDMDECVDACRRCAASCREMAS